MLLVFIILVPVLASILSLMVSSKTASYVNLLGSLVTAILAAKALILFNEGSILEFEQEWIPSLAVHFHLKLTSWNVVFLMLNALAFLLVNSWSFDKEYSNNQNFQALMSFTQAAIFGVFLSMDALMFYFFWELALIPIYFLISQWGGARRIQITLKFFIYTFVGSIFMLVAILYLYNLHGGSFAWEDWMQNRNNISFNDQCWLFWFFFIGLAVKIPLFPLHSWQSETYTTAPKPVLMILSAVMAKMGVFGFIQWLIYLFPQVYPMYQPYIVGLLLFGIIYASFIAMVGDSIIRILAFSSIAHLTMMILAMFTDLDQGMKAAVFQSFSHGIVVLGLWMLVDKVQESTGSISLKEIGGGLANSSSKLAFFFVLFAFANAGLPLTMNFVGEYMMLYAVYLYNPVTMIIAGTSVIWAAVYMLRLVRSLLYGEEKKNYKIHFNNTQLCVLALLVFILIYFGVYPYDLIHTCAGINQDILSILNN